MSAQQGKSDEYLRSIFTFMEGKSPADESRAPIGQTQSPSLPIQGVGSPVGAPFPEIKLPNFNGKELTYYNRPEAINPTYGRDFALRSEQGQPQDEQMQTPTQPQAQQSNPLATILGTYGLSKVSGLGGAEAVGSSVAGEAVGTGAQEGTVLVADGAGGSTVAGASNMPGIGGMLAGGYTGYQQAKGFQNLAKGKDTSTIQKAAMFPITGGFDQVLGLGKSGKGKDQRGRDSTRAIAKEIGLVDENYNVTLADGSKFDIGRDGGARLGEGESKRQVFDVDFSNELAGQTVGMVNPLAHLLAGGDKKLASDMAGYLTNAAMSNAKDLAGIKANVDAMLSSSGLSQDEIRQGLQDLRDAGKISPTDYEAFTGGLGNAQAKPVGGGSGAPRPSSGSRRPEEKKSKGGKAGKFIQTPLPSTIRQRTPNYLPMSPEMYGSQPVTLSGKEYGMALMQSQQGANKIRK